MNQAAIIQCLQSQVPGLLAVYAFGSRIQGNASADSDLDLAVLVAGYAEPELLWTMAGELSDISACPVDLLDLRAATTVMQFQIITTGQCWWTSDAHAAVQVALFETMVLSEKTELDSARAGLLADIQKSGSVYD